METMHKCINVFVDAWKKKKKFDDVTKIAEICVLYIKHVCQEEIDEKYEDELVVLKEMGILIKENIEITYSWEDRVEEGSLDSKFKNEVL